MTALEDISDERVRQDTKWGQQDHLDGTGRHTQPLLADTATGIADDDEAHYIRDVLQGRTVWRFDGMADRVGTWGDILLEEVFEAMAEDDPIKLRAELIQTAAVAVAWIESIDRKLAEAMNRRLLTTETPMPELQKCDDCGRDRTAADVDDYTPMQAITGATLGWYSGSDGEFCSECITRLMGWANR
jgi:hypothetical protein